MTPSEARPLDDQPRPGPPGRVLIFEDSSYCQQAGRVYTDRAFLHFALHLAERFPGTEVLGRLAPGERRSHYPLPTGVRFVPLPHYAALSDPSTVPVLLRSSGTAWAALRRADVAWLMGPHPVSAAMALIAPLAGTKVVLGVRQDLPTYVRRRHPGKRWTHAVADGLEAVWRQLARRCPVVVVGPDLARAYAHAPRLLELGISLVPRAQLDAAALRGDYDGRLQVLSVGRLESEKNPLLLADVLARLREHDDRWHLVVHGDGPLAADLQARLDELGVAEHAELRGYLPVDGGLRETYLSSHLLLHVSWTEGVPQVLYEAWAAGLPVVATDVGGVRGAAGGAALLVPPGDAEAAAAALRRLADDQDLRAGLVNEGRRVARENTMEAALDRLAELLSGSLPAGGSRPARPGRPARPSRSPARRWPARR